MGGAADPHALLGLRKMETGREKVPQLALPTPTPRQVREGTFSEGRSFRRAGPKAGRLSNSSGAWPRRDAGQTTRAADPVPGLGASPDTAGLAPTSNRLTWPGLRTAARRDAEWGAMCSGPARLPRTPPEKGQWTCSPRHGGDQQRTQAGSARPLGRCFLPEMIPFILLLGL